MRIADRGYRGVELAPHLFDIPTRMGEVFPQVDLRFISPPQPVDRDLRPLAVELHQPLHLDEVVAIEGLDDLRDAVPHLGFEMAAAVSENER